MRLGQRPELAYQNSTRISLEIQADARPAPHVTFGIGLSRRRCIRTVPALSRLRRAAERATHHNPTRFDALRGARVGYNYALRLSRRQPNAPRSAASRA